MDFDKLAVDGWIHMPGFIPKAKLEVIEKKIKIIFGVRDFDELSKVIIELDRVDKKSFTNTIYA